MKQIHLTGLLFLFFIGPFSGRSQPDKQIMPLHLFTDRDFCMTGDTIWFHVFLSNGREHSSHVIHFDLSRPDYGVVASVSVKSHEGWAAGYLCIPDTLNSGFCFLTAYLHEHRLHAGIPVEVKTLVVYNRFQTVENEIMVPGQHFKIVDPSFDSAVHIKIEKEKFSPREKVMVDLDLRGLDPDEMETVIVRAALLDELALNYGGRIMSETNDPVSNIPHFQEKDGILISGRVYRDASSGQRGRVVVFLSMIDDPGYLDYFVTDSVGVFHFFLKNAEGVGDVVLQAISAIEENLAVELTTNRSLIHASIPLYPMPVDPLQKGFIKRMSDVDFLTRLFRTDNPIPAVAFSMPQRFQVPFYGQPDRRVHPADFFDLPDFQSISRELLPGVQYRTREGQILIRLFNRNENRYFERDPFTLINGIPVFKNSLLAPLNSADIQYIDYSMQERVFGDLKFPGVLAIYLKDRSNSWIANHPNTFRFSIPLLQYQKQAHTYSPVSVENRTPDMRRVFYWQPVKTGDIRSFEFVLSDIRGIVEISLEGVTKNGKRFRSVKNIVVER